MINTTSTTHAFAPGSGEQRHVWTVQSEAKIVANLTQSHLKPVRARGDLRVPFRIETLLDAPPPHPGAIERLDRSPASAYPEAHRCRLSFPSFSQL